MRHWEDGMGDTAFLMPHWECGQCTTVLEGGTDKDRSPGMAMVSLIFPLLARTLSILGLLASGH